MNIKGLNQDVKIPVEIELEGNITHKFKVHYKQMTRSDVKKIVDSSRKRGKEATKLNEQLAELGEDSTEAARKKIADKIDKINLIEETAALERITGWSGWKQDGEEVEFSRELLEELNNVVPFFQAFDQAQYKATGARLKN